MKLKSSIVRVSPKYQVVIPRDFRDAAGIHPGLELQVIPSGTGLRLVPVRPLASLRGTVRRSDTVKIREKRDRS